MGIKGMWEKPWLGTTEEEQYIKKPNPIWNQALLQVLGTSGAGKV